MSLRFLFLLLTVSTLSVAQKGRKNADTILHEISGKAVVQCVFPDAVKVEKVNDYWYTIINANKRLLGFAMTSQSFCSDIIGYRGTTPVIIIMDKRGVIKKTTILSHQETLSYVNLLEEQGFFEQWNNKTLKEAKKNSLDAYSGATHTAFAIEKNIQFLLEKGSKIMPLK